MSTNEVSGKSQPHPESMVFYVASRASLPERVEMWREFRRRWPVNSTWIDHTAESGVPMADLWKRIAGEIRECTALLLFLSVHDLPLKGSLVEVGMALACGKPVRVVCPDVQCRQDLLPIMGSWMDHPLVGWAKSFEQAINQFITTPQPPSKADSAKWGLASQQLNIDFAETRADVEARSLHRVVRAMHDGHCPACGHLGSAESFAMLGRHSCPNPQCGFEITDAEAREALDLFMPAMRRNYEVFVAWRERRRASQA